MSLNVKMVATVSFPRVGFTHRFFASCKYNLTLPVTLISRNGHNGGLVRTEKILKIFVKRFDACDPFNSEDLCASQYFHLRLLKNLLRIAKKMKPINCIHFLMKNKKLSDPVNKI